jgi:hypothetical protein
MSFIDMPPSVEKKVNGKHEWKIGQIEEFVDAAKSYRDKAIILCMFQSGLAVKEICELNYGDVQDELERGVLPLCLKLVRQKTNVDFKTFFGRDAVKYLKLYLDTRTKLKPEDPLFIKERLRKGEYRITPEVIQQSFSEIAKDLDFIKLKDDAYNPARPHSLRAAFNSRLIGKIDETLRDFWMGHAIGKVAKAYLNMPTEEMRKLYMTAEEYLCIEKTSRKELEEIQNKEPEIAGQRIKELTDEVEKLKTQISSMYEFVHKNYDPLLDFVNELSGIPEFEELKRKLYERKYKQLSEDSV